jgi:hypothetical protein
MTAGLRTALQRDFESFLLKAYAATASFAQYVGE